MLDVFLIDWIRLATYVWAWWWGAAWWWWVVSWWWGTSSVWICSVQWSRLRSGWDLTGTGSGAGSHPRTPACKGSPDVSVNWEDLGGDGCVSGNKVFITESPTLGGCLHSICRSSWRRLFPRRWRWRRGRSGSSYLSPRQTSRTWLQ